MFIAIDRGTVVNTKLYILIIDNIKDQLVTGSLKAGDKLPTERAMAEMFQVSREPVREALKVLEYMGVVQNIHGKGMFIRSINVEDLLDIINFGILGAAEDIDDLFETREMIELQAVRLAARRRTDADILRMEKAIQAAAQDVEADKDGAIFARDFHIAVVRASQNKVLYRLYKLSIDLLKVAQEGSLAMPDNRKLSLTAHNAILERIKMQDEEGAAMEMKEHLRLARFSSSL